ncbi:MAG TPA: sulfatase-like hydrolase/transferase [Candidatus Angelobacter sp.]|nr:sulfatase-like hydrolase/transferase [Candidatus Angelobacter sp.]
MTTENTQIGHFDRAVLLKRSIPEIRLQPNTVFWIKLTAQATFGGLIVLDSLYLALCYITCDFFGWLNNPFFGWLQNCGYVAWILYFPLFLGALATIDVGQQRKRSRRYASILLVGQIVAGFGLFFSHGIKSSFGWGMLYGPNVRTPMGYITSYLEAIACLLPLLWISGIHVATALPAARQKKIVSTLRFSSFLMAALASFVLYSVWANGRLAAAGQPLSIVGLGFSMAAHFGIFSGLFVVLQWIGVISNRFPNPGIAQFALRSLVGWLALAFFLRKIIFPLLAFNNHLADLYAVAFSLTAALFVAGLALKIKEQHTLEITKDGEGLLKGRSWPVRILTLLAVACLFYEFVTRLAAIEWEHVLGSLVALTIWALLLWFFLSFARSSAAPKSIFLVVISLGAIGDLTGAKLLLSQHEPSGRAVNALEQYADYDPSLFLIQQALKPVIHDDAYDSFYRFLNDHGNMRAVVPAPEVTLAGDLNPTASDKPNIFLFVIDSLRRDYLSPYNSSVNFTPSMQAFAEESAVFQRAYTPYAGTILAEPAIWAGFQLLMNPTPLNRVNNLQKVLNVDAYHCYISYDTVLAELVPKSSNITVLNSGLNNWQQKEFGAVIRELEDDVQMRKHPEQPIFAFSQPQNVHTLSLNLYEKQIEIRPHPGFNDKYASAVEQVDATFGEFIRFLKAQHLYENSIIILTSDHGESLGEMGRQSHVSNLTPEIVRIPLIIHVPEKQKRELVWNTEAPASLHDITPTLYYLLGHRPIKSDDMLGHPLFALTQEELAHTPVDHYFLMSSYMPVFGVLSADQKRLFMVDASLHRNFYYDLETDPQALKNAITVPLRDYYEQIVRKDLMKIDKFYGKPD